MPVQDARGGFVTDQGLVIILGKGEVGRPLATILSRKFRCANIDIEPVEIDEPCLVLHVCYPFQISDFVRTTVRYIEKYRPALTIINSTVAPGTTRRVYEAAGKRPIAYSPVRGKHVRMEQDMLRYKKFVAGCDAASTRTASDHFAAAGFKTDTFPSLEIAEFSKLVETTWLGILIGWAQEVERLAAQYGGSYDDVNAFIKEIGFLPSHTFPGHIGGHCVMPNIAILQSQVQSAFLDAVVESNEAKRKHLAAFSAGEKR